MCSNYFTCIYFMEEKLKILYINGGLMDRGGISSVIMNYYLNFTDDRICVDFLGQGNGNGERDVEIISRGGKVFNIPSKSMNLHLNYKQFKKILKEGKYDIVHSHADSGNAYFLKIAKECQVSVRISHSHNTNYTIKNKLRILLNEFQKRQIKRYATNLWACSYKAAEWLYGSKENVEVIHNAINIKNYAFSEDDRKQIREVYELGNRYIIGIVGRLDYQKNHYFILRVMEKYVEVNPKAKLMVIGDGKLRDELIRLTESLSLQNNIIFVGQVENVIPFYSALDVLVMPSLFEGLPVSAIEAQISGLPCIISDQITKEVGLGHNVEFVSINDVGKWTSLLETYKYAVRDSDDIFSYVRNAGYDIQMEAENIQKKYWHLKEVVK